LFFSERHLAPFASLAFCLAASGQPQLRHARLASAKYPRRIAKNDAGLLAELADAMDSKSAADVQKTPGNTAFCEDDPSTLSRPCPEVASNPTLARLLAAAMKLPSRLQEQLALFAESMAQ
jgi:hypothetical protein